MKDFPIGPHKTDVQIFQQAEVDEETETQPDLVLTPGGLRPRKLVQAIHSGEAVRSTENGIIVIPLTESDSTTNK